MGNKTLGKSDFNNYKAWYGIEFASVTIFLFWVRSDEFLPIDKNTRIFLGAIKVISKVPHDYKSYIALLKKFDIHNSPDVKSYGVKGLYREITHISYKVVSEGIETETTEYSKSLLNLYNNISYSKEVKIKEHIAESTVLETEMTIKADVPVTRIPQSSILENLITTSQFGFRIVAIRPLPECNGSYLNVLAPEQIFHFEKAFKINADKVEYHRDKDIALYNIDNLKINVCAVVGKNGSGKSSLVELFFRIVNNTN